MPFAELCTGLTGKIQVYCVQHHKEPCLGCQFVGGGGGQGGLGLGWGFGGWVGLGWAGVAG